MTENNVLFGSKATIWFFLSCACWFIDALLFLIDPSSSAIPVVSVLSLASSAVLIVRDPQLSVYLLPLPMMIGPVFAFSFYGIGYITAGDLYSVILIARSFLIDDSHMRKTGKIILLTGASILVLSTVFSVDLTASIVGCARILQYALLVRVSMIFVRRPAEYRMLFNSWVFITTLCSIMMLWHFFSGRINMIYWVRTPGYDESLNLERLDVFFRAHFFYASFFVPMGLSLIYSFVAVLKRIETSRMMNALLSATIPVNFIALIMNNTRSMIVPVIILCGMITVWFFWRSVFGAGLKFRKMLMLILVSGFSIWMLFGSLVTAPQKNALFERVINKESVILRLSIWDSALAKILDNPFRLLLGWGPQATMRQYERPFMQKLLTGSLGNTEGAFDSTIIGFIVEFGLVLSTFIFIYISIWLVTMIRYYTTNRNPAVFSILMMAAALVFCHVFQQFSFTPPGLIALQVFAIQPNA
jgi:hypothetical protein